MHTAGSETSLAIPHVAATRLVADVSTVVGEGESEVRVAAVSVDSSHVVADFAACGKRAVTFAKEVPSAALFRTFWSLESELVVTDTEFVSASAGMATTTEGERVVELEAELEKLKAEVAGKKRRFRCRELAGPIGSCRRPRRRAVDR